MRKIPAVARQRRTKKSVQGRFRLRAMTLAIGALMGGYADLYAAQPGTVLPAGTVPIPRAVFYGQATISAPIATSGGNLLTIDQTSQKAIIDWNSFNIARGSEVRFNQPGASASALNRIYDADPSIIQGKLTANGQVYLINQNGILFDRGSQVNVYSLIASTLDIDPELYKSGILSNSSGLPDFIGSTGTIEIGAHGDLTEVARIETQAGGSVIILAPAIVNNGVITSPDGQVILAAGDKAYLFSNPDPNDFTMRGLFVEVEANGAPVNLTRAVGAAIPGRSAGDLSAKTGDVFNTGEIRADRGNATLAGLAVNQAGLVSAQTAVNQNGSVWLIARGGNVTTTAGSRTETPIAMDTTTVLKEDQDFTNYRPVVKVEANQILHQGSIVSPDGLVSLNTSGPGARVLLDNGSQISVAGTWADVPLDKNLVTFTVTSNDLKDAPEQKGGVLLGKTVTVDLRSDPSLFDLGTKKGAVARTVAEKTAQGGDIAITAGEGVAAGDIILREGAVLDVTGGGYRYAGGSLSTTKLLSGGKAYDIGSAPADLPYESILRAVNTKTYAKWGASTVFAGFAGAGSATESAYVEGKSGGNIVLNASNMVLDGQLRGGASAGRYQTTPAAMPSGGSLTIGDVTALTSGTVPNFRVTDIVLASAPVLLPADFGLDSALPAERKGRVYLAPGSLSDAGGASITGYAQRGFSVADLYANGRIELPSGAVIQAAPGATLGFTAGEIAISGTIDAAGGSVNLKAQATGYQPGDVSPSRAALTNPLITLAATGRIDVSGVWLNDALAANGSPGAPLLTPSYLNGGSASLVSGQLALAEGSVIDVSGGGRLSASRKLTAGNGGSIVLRSGLGASDPQGYQADLGADLRGYSAATGGSLDITGYKVRIADTASGADGELWLGPSFFQQGGFSQYSVNGDFGLDVAAGTIVRPLVQAWVVDTARASRLAGARSIAGIADRRTLPLELRKPASISLKSGAALDIGTGAVIATDPHGSISVAANNSLMIDGTLDAPAGSINVSVHADETAALTAPGLVLGEHARLLARGSFLPAPNTIGLLSGEILRGGQITLQATNSQIITSTTSLMDVSGIAQAIDIGGTTLQPAITRTLLHGDAGGIAIRGTDNMRLEGRMAGNADAGAAGGSFALESIGNGNPLLLNYQRIVLAQTPISWVTPNSSLREAYLALSALDGGGFDKLRFKASSEVQFRGDVQLQAARGVRLEAPLLAAQSAATVSLSGARIELASYVGSDPNNALSAPLVVPTAAGPAVFNADAGLIDLYGMLTLNGFSRINLTSASDIRGTGKPVDSNLSDTITNPDRMVGGLVSEASMALHAQQVYPTSASDFTFAVNRVDAQGVRTRVGGGSVTITQAGGAAGGVLSAGGSITIDADAIAQNGTLKAPLGSIALNGGSSLALGAGSVTSVSAAGMTVPFGTTVNGQSWVYNNMVEITSPPAKRIALNAGDIQVGSGAVIDVSGGGAIAAIEFVPGIGGSRDTLLADGTFAIVPSASLQYAPYDSHIAGLKDLGFGKDSNIYDSVYLSAGSGVPAGEYVLLPGYYALLPGAYIVQKLGAAAYRDMQPGQSALLSNGATVVAGKLAVAGTSIQEQRWTGFAIREGSAAKRESEYQIAGADFFASLAKAQDRPVPSLPDDAGRLAVAALGNLDFNGLLRGNPSGNGRSAQVDITGAQLAVVAHKGDGTAPAGAVELEAGTLSALGASLLLGGARSDTNGGTRISVVSDLVTVASGADLRGPEIILAAKDTVTVDGGAAVSGTGTFSGTAPDLLVDDTIASSGALLRVSSGNQVNLSRGAQVDRSRGTLDIRAGAAVSAAKSMLLDATLSTVSSGALSVTDGGAISLGAGNIRIGEAAPPAANSLLIGNAQLAAFDRLDTIALRSYSGIDFYGGATLGADNFNRISLDAADINGFDGAAVNVRAKNVTLQNTSGAITQSATGAGALTVSADQVVLGGGAKSIGGFATVAIKAAGDITASGTGDLRVAADLTLESARVSGALKSDQAIIAVDDSQAAKAYYKVSLQRPATPLAASGSPALGAKLAITGSSIDHAGDIELPAGSVTLTATGMDGITMRNGARVFAGGAARTFGTTSAFAPGGGIALVALQGVVVTAAGSSMDVSGAAGGGDAGSFSLTSGGIGTAVRLDGVLSASAAAGYRQGRATLDLADAGNFSAINARLNQGGFSESRDIRVRSGDVSIAGENPFTQRPGDVVIANHFKLSADQGSITVGGTIDASGASGGGTIELDAMNDLNLAAGGFLLARGTSAASNAADAYSHGGSVELSARDGILNMANGALIDVSANAAGKSDGGKVVLSARRTKDGTGADADLAMNLAGTINVGAGVNSGQAGSVTVEGVHGYDGITDTALASNAGSGVMADYQSFIGNAQAIVARLVGQGLSLPVSSLNVAGGVELRSSGNMVLSSAWDLTSSSWMPAASPGRLTLRAAGDLTIRNTLGLPNDDLANGRSWDIRLVGGADLNAADAMAVNASQTGDVSIARLSGSANSTSGTVGKVRTGTGHIDVAAGRDFVIADTAAVIYTSGRGGAPDAVLPIQNGSYPTGGGDLTISAQRDARGTSTQQWINDWLRRTTTSNQSVDGQPAGWWANRASFRQNVGTFAGGDISIQAGRDVNQLSAMSATSGRVVTGTSGAQLDVQGGGDLTIASGRDVIGGEYLVARGDGRVQAGGAVGASVRTALFLMGESGDAATRHAGFTVNATGDVNLQNISNPTILTLTNQTGMPVSARRANFFTYAPDSEVDVTSVSGDIYLGAAAAQKPGLVSDGTSLSEIMAPRLMTAALQGGIRSGMFAQDQGRITLYPSTNGSLRVLAANDIQNLYINVSDADPATLPDWRAARQTTAQIPLRGNSAPQLGPTGVSQRLITPQPGSAYPYLIRSDASVIESRFFLPAKSVVDAGKDLQNVQLDLQNLSASDVSVVQAGRDIRYTGALRSGARFDNGGGYIRIGGPGRLLVKAARDINLGSSPGIDARGDLANFSLPSSTSADLTVIAGYSGNASFAQFDAFFQALKSAGVARDKAQADSAIALLFNDGNTQAGNITMFFSQIKTQGGSGIDLLAPKGNINAGLPTPQQGDIGILTYQGGNIRSYLSGDFNVNQSKVITLQGGDILIYSSNGNIDAGRGALDSRTTLPPRRITDPVSGLTFFQPPQDASGSGIRTLSSDPDGPGPLKEPKPGDVYLFAPSGFIDAGEAGVSSAGNIFVAALQVLNSSNFSAAGSSTGVPLAPSTSISAGAVGAGSVGASAAKSAEEATKALAASTAAAAPTETFKPSFITVEVLGIGDGSTTEDAKDRDKKK